MAAKESPLVVADLLSRFSKFASEWDKNEPDAAFMETILAFQFKFKMTSSKLLLMKNMPGFKDVSIKPVLFSLLHARKCSDSGCHFPRCSDIKEILLHLKTCKLDENCPKKETVRIEELIFHWLWCAELECSLCLPFKSSDRKITGPSGNVKATVQVMPSKVAKSGHVKSDVKFGYFDKEKSEIMLTAELSGLSKFKYFNMFTEEFHFDAYKWLVQILNIRDMLPVEMKLRNKEYLTIAVRCYPLPDTPKNWSLDCICDIKIPGLHYCGRKEKNFCEGNGCFFMFLEWDKVVGLLDNGRVTFEILLSKVSFAEFCSKEPNQSAEFLTFKV